MKRKDKKNPDQQAQPASEIIAEEQNIPVPEEGRFDEEQTYGNTVPEQNASTNPDVRTVEEKPETKGETDEDTPKNNKTVFDDEKWQEKVNVFFETYPVAKEFSDAIGREIIEDRSLHTQEDCLEKALLRVLCKEYVSPRKLAADENFLREYIYPSDKVRQVIVDDYLDGIEKSMPPKSISSRGQITLTPPSRPKSIAEAGAVIRTMLNNRRI